MSFLGRHWRTAAGAAAGAALGGAYAHFVGCHTGTCPLTSNVWIAATFFGITGAVVGVPGGRGVGSATGEPKRRGGAEPGEV